MQLHKNKIAIISGVYLLTLIVIALFFGIWHNNQLSGGRGSYLLFTTLIFLLIVSLTWFYIALFKVFKKEIEQNAARLLTPESDIKTDNDVAEEITVSDKFDLEAFVASIIPASKKPVAEYCEEVLQNLSRKMNIVQGLFYIRSNEEGTFEAIARYAYYSEHMPPEFKAGESLPGQAVKDKKIVIIQNVPESYVPVVSGLGSSKPKNLVMIPVTSENDAVGLIEIAVFKNIDTELETALKELGGKIGKNIIKLIK